MENIQLTDIFFVDKEYSRKHPHMIHQMRRRKPLALAMGRKAAIFSFLVLFFSLC